MPIQDENASNEGENVLAPKVSPVKKSSPTMSVKNTEAEGATSIMCQSVPPVLLNETPQPSTSCSVPYRSTQGS
ncbi:hypothetical protein X975_17931, partial [Stegodyphus mimosarum]